MPSEDELDRRCPWGRSTPNLGLVTLTVDQKVWLGREIVEKRKDVKYFANRYSLKVRNLYNYAESYRNKRYIGATGRPSKISSSVFDKFKNEKADKYQVTEETFNDLLIEAAVETAYHRNISPSQASSMSRSTLWRYKQMCKAKTGNAEFTTDARAKAVADVRNAVICDNSFEIKVSV